ncbi:unnamed protein product [Scytosiphon promiscuus]
MFLLSAFGQRAVPGISGRSGGGGLPPSSLTALSLALRLVVARGWAASAATSTTAPGSFLSTSSWRTPPPPGVPCTRHRGNFGGTGCTNNSADGGGGLRTSYHRRRQRGSGPAWGAARELGGTSGGSIRAFATSRSPTGGSSSCKATASILSERQGIPPTGNAGDAEIFSHGGDSSADGRENPGDLPEGTASKLTMRSLRTARDRGSVKNKSKKGKPVKGEPPSRAADTASSGSSNGSNPRGGPKLLRLSKLLADRAVGTRSEVDTLVRRGRVKVDGVVTRSPKKKLAADCVIEVDGEVHGPVPLIVAFHKPKGVITTLSDDWDREDLSDVLPKSLLLKHHPVGRLDADSSGLLLLSSDGALTHRLLNPRFEVEREYVASVEVLPTSEEPGDSLVAALGEGVTTADGVYKADVPGIDGRDVRVVVREGKNRMVRRMLANAGYPVLELRRERYGRIMLGDLQEGEHTPVLGDALEWAQSVLQLQAPADVAVEVGSDGHVDEEEAVP